MSEHGITHPSEKMLSGGETQASKNNANEEVVVEEEKDGTEKEN